MFKFGKTSQSNMIMLEEETIKLCNLALSESDIDFAVIDGYRTSEEQYEMYSNGKSELDGTTNKSAHQSGLAIDVYPFVRDSSGSRVDCWNYDNPKAKVAWLEIGRAFLRAGRLLGYNVEWGITYNINGAQDFPHFQINKG